MSFSQTCPPNLDFESGSFANWECFTGTTSTSGNVNQINLTISGPVAGRHEMISAPMSGTSLDPYGLFPRLCPYGGNYSVKLGNDASGAQAEGLSYTFTVPSNVDTFTFTYFYAVVFQDPDHNVYEQPRFFVSAYEVATGQLINCASFDYISNGGIPGFETSTTNNSVLFKDWSPASLQFAGLQGREVRLEFRTADCTRGGHFGYAYLDVGSGCSNIMATAPYCVETNSLLLNAPYGFQSYTWYNENYTAILGNQQTLTLSPPPVTSGVFHVDVIPYPGYGCRDTMQATVTPLPVPDTPVSQTEYIYCQSKPAIKLTGTALPGHYLIWYTSAVGGTGVTIAPIPPTAVAGTFYYYVSQKVLFGCESFRKKITVIVTPMPAASFTINKTRQCQNGNAFVFKSTSTNRSNCIFDWDLGNGQTISSADDSVVNYTYPNAGNFTVKLRVTNSGTCYTEKTLQVTVVPKPVASFNYPAVICEKQTQVIINNTSSVPGDVATITKWWWNTNGSIQQTFNPTTVTPVNPGAFPVQLVVTTTEGCISDTNNTTIAVHYKPRAAFKYSTPLCNNEVIRFTDLSPMPPGSAPESIVKWTWQFDNNITSLQQNPGVGLAPGLNRARLVTETDFGCKSDPVDSLFEVFEKPHIQLAINDSCVFRVINYQAIDISNSVNAWYWDFGNGLQKSVPLVSRSYSTEGYRPLTLMAATIRGCKDTITRPFTIYDNKAFAGRDTVNAWNEPVQLNAHGGPNVTYTWTPSLGLNDPTLENPVALLAKDQLYRLDAMSDKGCDSHTKILIRRYKGPELYIPSGFTPDGDGMNDVLRVFPVGIKKFIYFAVYNRYGQKIFYTEDPTKGWDGKINGNQVPSGAYIAIASAVDYRGNSLMNKIPVTLVR